MNRRDFICLGSLALAVRHRASAAAMQDDRFEELARLIQTKMSEYHVPGAAFGVFKDGRTTLRAFGVTNVDDPQPVTADTLFTVASISKTVTATSVMNLAQQGRIDLKAPVQRYIRDFRVQDESVSREVTVWNLLTHTPGWEGQLNTDDRGTETLANFVSSIRDLPQLSMPGTVWSYNNAGFAVAGRVLEAVTGKTIHEAMRELVFNPVGMKRAFTRPADVMTYRYTLGHREQAGRTVVIRPFQSTSSTPAGGVATTIAEMLLYARFHLGDGSGADGKPVLARATLEQMRSPQLKKNSTEDEMGIGWHLRRLNGVQTAAHGGTLNGHCLLVQMVPERNMAFSILTNHTDGWRLVQDVERAALKTYEGLSLAPNQRIGHRGVNEAMTGHSTPLETQPDLEAYVGMYRRPPLGNVDVRGEDGKLSVRSGGGQNRTTLAFYAPDAAYAISGVYTGTPYEFVRNSEGKVAWIRINGRVAKKDGAAM